VKVHVTLNTYISVSAHAAVNCSFRALYGHADNEGSTGFYGSPSLTSAKRYN